MLVTAYLVRWADGYIEVSGAGTRREALLQLGNAPSTAEATRIATALLGRTSTADEDISAVMEPVAADVPYSDFAIGDTVTVPGPTGAIVTRRVVGFAVTEDAEGFAIFVPELA